MTLTTLAAITLGDDEYICPEFPALLDGRDEVWVTAVLERTAVVYANDEWANRILVRKDRVQVAPGVVRVAVDQAARLRRLAADRGRNVQSQKWKEGRP